MALLCVLLAGCGGVQFSERAVQANSTDSLGTGGNPGPDGGATQQTIKSLQPALAVRGIACLMCHADIRANIITDFGHGSDWYLGGPNVSLDQAGAPQSTFSWFSDLASSWQSAIQIVGQVYVPNAAVTPGAQASLGPNFAGQPLIQLKDLMTTPFQAAWNFDNNALEAKSPMSMKITPPAGADPVVAKDKIVIRAPDISEISALAPDLFNAAGPSGVKRVGSSIPVEFITGGSGSAAYLTNDPANALNCAGQDIVVKGTLYLRGLNINAQGGCRLYVSGSVFIEDGITYVGKMENQNLQITSASAIVMGISLSRLQYRLVTDHRAVNISGSISYADRSAQVLQEAKNIGTLRDAQDDYGGTRASFDYNGLLLNAPMIHSRYLGQVKGTIIAEVALFALGQFHFEFDPVFTNVNVLPLLQNAILVSQ
jgi:hypothetical protein